MFFFLKVNSDQKFAHSLHIVCTFFNTKFFADLSSAIRVGEIINPNAPLNREQAIAKLKEAKDLLELGMMTKEEFDTLRAELSPIIKGN
jgi:hypothetical protein